MNNQTNQSKLGKLLSVWCGVVGPYNTPFLLLAETFRPEVYLLL